MRIERAQRRDLAYFLAGPVLVTLIVTALYNLDPWPVCTPMQAANFLWPVAGGYLAAGTLGVFLSNRVGVPSAPALADGMAWRRLLLWSALPGLAAATFDLSQSLIPLLHQRSVETAHATGMTWFNVALPWSIAHYTHAAVLSECVFRLGSIPLLTWLVSTLALRGRAQAQVFWGAAALMALVEPIEQAVFSHGASLAHLSPLEAGFTLYGVAFQLFEAWLFRRFGWPAPIAYRMGYYLIAHVAGGYLFPPDSIFYPGPH